MTNRKDLFLHFNMNNPEVAESIVRVLPEFGSFDTKDDKIIFSHKNGTKAIFNNVLDFASHLVSLMLEECDEKWNPELEILMKNGIKAEGIRYRKGVNFVSYTATIDYPKNKPETRNNHATQLSAGTFKTPVEAYKARIEAVALRTQFLEKNKKIDEFKKKLSKNKKRKK